jgi:hypothetical protein
MNKKVYAEWQVTKLPVDVEKDFYISCGVGKDCWERFFVYDEGSELTIKQVNDYPQNYYLVRLECPDMGLTEERGWWLSPSDLGCDVDPFDFGVIDSSSKEDMESIDSMSESYFDFTRNLKESPRYFSRGMNFILNFYTLDKHITNML